MKAEQKVPSVEMCRKLWDAGLRLETERTWRLDLRGFDGPLCWRLDNERSESKHGYDPMREGEWWLVAPDLAELLFAYKPELPVNLEEVSPDKLIEWILEDIALGNLTVAEVNTRIKGQP